jgi:hypothetical protein
MPQKGFDLYINYNLILTLKVREEKRSVGKIYIKMKCLHAEKERGEHNVAFLQHFTNLLALYTPFETVAIMLKKEIWLFVILAGAFNFPRYRPPPRNMQPPKHTVRNSSSNSN